VSTEWVALEGYRAGISGTTREAGEQAALEFASSWADEAFECIERLAADGLEFTADDLVEEVGQPASAAAIGPVFRKAANAGLIRAVGYATSKRISRHNGLQRIWVGRRSEEEDEGETRATITQQDSSPGPAARDFPPRVVKRGHK
jgi:hypothetical protein